MKHIIQKILAAVAFAANALGAQSFGQDALVNIASNDGGISEPTTAFAYIQVVNPDDNFSTTSEVQLDMTNVSGTWTRYSFELSVDASVPTDQLLQFGFANTTTGYASSGILYDNIAFGVNNA